MKVSVLTVTNSAECTFANGVEFDSTGTAIHVGTTAGTINSAGKLDLQSATANPLNLVAGGVLTLTDTYRGASTYTNPLPLSGSTAEWSAFVTKFGQASLLGALVQAASISMHAKTSASVVGNQNANVNITGVGGGANLDAPLGDYSAKDFVADVDIHLNGVLLRNAASAGSNDVYPGTSQANGDLKFTFKVKNGDQITMEIF